MWRLISALLLIAALALSILAYERTLKLERKISLPQTGITNLLLKKDLQDALKWIDQGNKREARKCVERALDRLKEESNKNFLKDIQTKINDIWKYIYKGDKK
jgi:transposase